MGQVKLKENVIQIGNALPKIGMTAPDFKLVNTDLAEMSLKNYAGKRKLLSFVPSLDTAVCSLSTKKFNDAVGAHPEVVVLVISSDLPFAQKRFCGAEKVNNVHTLSMMRGKDAALSYGVLMEDGPLAGLSARAVFVLDEKDKLIYFEVVPEITSEPDYSKALAALLPGV
ncbi:MAG: thiol peroxidase [Rhabdochlamydiaceae bacterium]|nr:thiol peroxidase [Rhabdochlamydiaceae bacterium]